MAKSSLKVELSSGVWYIKGVIDEYADLEKQLGSATAPLRLNLAGVTRMNSVGIRSFLLFLSSWGQKPIIYEACPVEFIDQLMLIPALLGIPKPIAIVDSLYVPYFCNSCGEEADLLVLASDINKATSDALAFPDRKCQHCQSAMIVEPDHYARFLISA